MILINMPIPTVNGWSGNFYNRIIKELGKQKYDIIAYPEFTESFNLKEKYLQSIILYGGSLSLDYLFKNKEKLKKIRKCIDKIIFLDANQAVDEQINFMRNNIFFNNMPKIYVLYYIDPSYINAFDNRSDVLLRNYFNRAKNYDGILVGNKYSITHFNRYFGQEYFIEGKNAFVVGGCLDSLDMTFKIPKSIFWAGRIDNPTKNFDKLIEIVSNENFADYTFYLGVDLDDYSKLYLFNSNYENLKLVIANNSEEYNRVATNCKYILSTAKCETFGYAVFEAASKFTIPILPNIESSYRYFDKIFLYDSIDDIIEIINKVDLFKYNDDSLYYNFTNVIENFSTHNFIDRLVKL